MVLLDFLAVVIFIIYAVIRSMSDNKKGKERRAPQRTAPRQKKQEPVILAEQGYNTERKAFRTSPQTQAGDREYGLIKPRLETDAWRDKEKAAGIERKKEFVPVEPEASDEFIPPLSSNAGWSLSHDELRKAVILSEIIQRPVCYRMRGRRVPVFNPVNRLR